MEQVSIAVCVSRRTGGYFSYKGGQMKARVWVPAVVSDGVLVLDEGVTGGMQGLSVEEIRRSLSDLGRGEWTCKRCGLVVKDGERVTVLDDNALWRVDQVECPNSEGIDRSA